MLAGALRSQPVSRCLPVEIESALTSRTAGAPAGVSIGLPRRGRPGGRKVMSAVNLHKRGACVGPHKITSLFAAALAAAWSLAGCAWSQSPRVVTAIVDVSAYPSPESGLLNDVVILIEEGRIASIGSPDEVEIPPGARRIEGAGAVALAGYWNSHVHLTTPVLLRPHLAGDAQLEGELRRAFTRWGFTTVVDLASTGAIADEVSARTAGAPFLGPRVLSAREPFYPPAATPIYARPIYEAFDLPSAEVNTAAEAAERARQQIQAGARALKLFTGSIQGESEVAHMPAGIIAAVTQEAQARKVPVFAHPTDREGVDRAVRGGVDVLAHAAPLMGEWDEAYATGLARAGVAMTPTLSLFHAVDDPRTPVATAVSQTAALHRAGGTVLFGTDAGFTEDFDTRTELRLLESAIGWRGVLAALTTAPAAVFGEDDRRGRLAPGMAADLVLIGGDPAHGAERLADVRLVIRAGQVIYDAGARTVTP